MAIGDDLKGIHKRLARGMGNLSGMLSRRKLSSAVLAEVEQDLDAALKELRQLIGGLKQGK